MGLSKRSLLLIFLLALLAWARALTAPFWLDDYLQLERARAALLDPRALLSGFHFALADVSPLWLANESWSVRYFRPLVNAIFVGEWSLWGDWPVGYHATNLLLHGVASVLFAGVVARFTRRRRVALLAGLIFALHPSHQDSVGWITGRTDLVAAIPFFGALWFQLRARERGRDWSGWALLLLALAFLAKESAAAFAPVAAGLAWYDSRGQGAAVVVRRMWRAAWPALLLTVAYVAFRLATGGFGTPGSAYLTPPSDPAFLHLAIWRYFQYLLNLLFLVPVEPVVVGPALAARPGAIALLALLVAALLAAALRVRRARPLVIAGLFFWAVTLAPAIPIVEGQRFLYLPSAGYALAFAAALEGWLWRRRWVLGGLLAMLLTAAVVKSTFRAHLVRETMAPIAELATLRDEFRAGDRLYFIDLPPLVCMGFGAAVRQILGRDDLSVTALTLAPELPPSAARWIERGGGAPEAGKGPAAERLRLRRDRAGRLTVERVGGEYFATYMERFFLWGQPLPREGSLIDAHDLKVEIGPAGEGGGIRSLRFAFDGGLNSRRNWFFLCKPSTLERLRPGELPVDKAGMEPESGL